MREKPSAVLEKGREGDLMNDHVCPYCGLPVAPLAYHEPGKASEDCVAALRREVERLRKSLRPFAHQADIIASNGDMHHDGTPIDDAVLFRLWSSYTAISVGDCRRAREAVTP